MTHLNPDDGIGSGGATMLAYGMGFVMMVSAAFAVVFLLLLVGGLSRAEAADREQIQRGKYLVTLGLCTDCHTPGYFFGKPDMTRFLGGSEVGFELPGLGVFHGPNLTSDNETGLGNWSADEIDRA